MHGDNGFVYYKRQSVSRQHMRAYGHKLNDGDIVGFGIIWETNEVFLTHNGEWMGVILAQINSTTSQLYPSIGLRSKGALVKLNFGAKPFIFDFSVRT